mmetsp:Transcript_100719/g.307897  ORF Transcript_100719/g.307897 Transcript_100719/m.307897 type:complete len:467 (+) Transcript_100719:1124-2524(+)
MPTVHLVPPVARAVQRLVSNFQHDAHVRRHGLRFLRRDAEELVVEARHLAVLEHGAVARHGKPDRVHLPVIDVGVPPCHRHVDLRVRTRCQHAPIRERLEAGAGVPRHDRHDVVDPALGLRRAVDDPEALLALADAARHVQDPRRHAQVRSLRPVGKVHPQGVAPEDEHLVPRQGERDLRVVVGLRGRRQHHLAALVLHPEHDAQLFRVNERHVLLKLLRVVGAQIRTIHNLSIVKLVEACADERARAAPRDEGLLVLELRGVRRDQCREVRERLVHPLDGCQIVRVQAGPELLHLVRPQARELHAVSGGRILRPRALALYWHFAQVIFLGVLLQLPPLEDIPAHLRYLRRGGLTLEHLHQTKALVRDLVGDLGGELLDPLGGGVWASAHEAGPSDVEAAVGLRLGRLEGRQLVLRDVDDLAREGVHDIGPLVLVPAQDAPTLAAANLNEAADERRFRLVLDERQL